MNLGHAMNRFSTGHPKMSDFYIKPPSTLGYFCSEQFIPTKSNAL